MDILRTAWPWAILMSIPFLILSCGGNTSTDQATDPQEEQTETTDTTYLIEESSAVEGKEYTSAYVCPMHCEGSGSDQPGTCPVCKMKYVENENFRSEKHDHEN